MKGKIEQVLRANPINSYGSSWTLLLAKITMLQQSLMHSTNGVFFMDGSGRSARDGPPWLYKRLLRQSRSSGVQQYIRTRDQ